MGICFGHQLVCRALLGKQSVRASPNQLEAGWEDINFNSKAMNILNIGANERIWQHHFDEVVELFLDPINTRLPKYFHIVINSNGVSYDAQNKTDISLFLKSDSTVQINEAQRLQNAMFALHLGFFFVINHN